VAVEDRLADRYLEIGYQIEIVEILSARSNLIHLSITDPLTVVALFHPRCLVGSFIVPPCDDSKRCYAFSLSVYCQKSIYTKTPYDPSASAQAAVGIDWWKSFLE
jgi:hypothetical protein